jgi:hypothetical protein
VRHLCCRDKGASYGNEKVVHAHPKPP